MFYLGANVFAFTVFSVQYRLRPLLKAGDTNLLLFAVLSLPPFGILYFFTMRHDIFNLFISNSVASAVIYLFLRQFAIFESRYYHSISKSSVPLKQLKKQNYMTGIYLSEFFLILFLLLTLVPLLIFSNFVSDLFASILPVIFTAIFAFINFLGSLFLGNDTIATPEEGNYLRERSEDQPWVFVLSYILVVVMIMIAIHVIPKAIRMIIQNAPKYRKYTSETDDGIRVFGPQTFHQVAAMEVSARFAGYDVVLHDGQRIFSSPSSRRRDCSCPSVVRMLCTVREM